MEITTKKREITTENNALSYMVGGNHYHRLTIQPWVLILDIGCNFFAGNVIKYVSRYPFKNGRQDLEKALHVIQFMSENYVKCGIKTREIKALHRYCRENNFNDYQFSILSNMLISNYDKAEYYLRELIAEEYDNKQQ